MFRSPVALIVSVLASLALIAGPAAAVTPDDAGVTAERQPLMKQALAKLNKAIGHLQKASHDKGGHRVAALAEAKLAKAEVKLGIAYDNRNDADLDDVVMERQPQMRKAKAALVSARALLASASHDKGGHRVKALAHVDAAIAHVNKGIVHDNRN